VPSGQFAASNGTRSHQRVLREQRVQQAAAMERDKCGLHFKTRVGSSPHPNPASPKQHNIVSEDFSAFTIHPLK